jgi:hypothetical protein
MAKGANGTIQINTQTIKQREQFGGADGKFGVATDRLGANSLFPLSPIATNDQDNMYQGTISGDGSALLADNNPADIYDVYANIVDPTLDTGTAGFGFDNSSRFGDEHAGKAFLNYRHPNNPFIDNSGVAQLINDGSKYNNIKAYKGHADLAVSDINNPTSGENVTPNSDISIEPDGASYGHNTSDYRTQIANSSNSEYGQHNNSLGEYFKEKY